MTFLRGAPQRLRCTGFRWLAFAVAVTSASSSFFRFYFNLLFIWHFVLKKKLFLLFHYNFEILKYWNFDILNNGNSDICVWMCVCPYENIYITYSMRLTVDRFLLDLQIRSWVQTKAYRNHELLYNEIIKLYWEKCVWLRNN